MKKKGGKNVIIAITAGAVLLAGIFVFAALYSSANSRNSELDEQLALSGMELYIRRYAEDTGKAAEETKAREYSDELSLRKDLKESMLGADEEELLTLVNPWNPLDENRKIRTVKIGRRGLDEDMFFDERGAEALSRMVADCEAAGCRPVIISAYRTREYQQKLFDNKVQREIENGVSPDYAPESAATSVARPGTSEHELGLSVDIIDDFNPNLDNSQEWTDTQRWLMAHCTEYGFILRYPVGTTDTTGVVYEPWHYRYVGVAVAKEYAESGAATFEEFLDRR